MLEIHRPCRDNLRRERGAASPIADTGGDVPSGARLGGNEVWRRAIGPKQSRGLSVSEGRGTAPRGDGRSERGCGCVRVFGGGRVQVQQAQQAIDARIKQRSGDDGDNKKEDGEITKDGADDDGKPASNGAAEAEEGEAK
eukprot:6094269-Pyramimonas_sp.AAC.3